MTVHRMSELGCFVLKCRLEYEELHGKGTYEYSKCHRVKLFKAKKAKEQEKLSNPKIHPWRMYPNKCS